MRKLGSLKTQLESSKWELLIALGNKMGRFPVAGIVLSGVAIIGLFFVVGSIRFAEWGIFPTGRTEIDVVESMRSEWESVYDNLLGDETIYRRGFRRPSGTSCFLWVERCATLASQPAIISRLKGNLGPNILLYAIKFLSSADTSDVAASMDVTARKCQRVADVIIGGSIEIFHKPHQGKSSNLTTTILKTPQEPTLSGKLVLIIYGDQPYNIVRQDNHTQSPVIVLRYASSNCSIRMRAESDLYMPPVLQVSGESSSSTLNDVRTGLIPSEPRPSFQLPAEEHSQKNFPVVPESNITVFQWKNMTLSNPTFGCISTGLLDTVTFDLLQDAGRSNASFEPTTLRQRADETALVAITGSFRVHKADPRLSTVKEVLELKEHAFAYVPSGVWHSLEGLGSLVRVGWRGRKGRENYYLASGAGLVTLSGGQGYDPSNDRNCNMLLVMLQGEGLQVLPFDYLIENGQAMVVSAGQPCLLWNSDRWPVKFVVFYVCERDKNIERIFNGDWALASFLSGEGKLMRR